MTSPTPCVAVRRAERADLGAVLALIEASALPVAGVAEALPGFVVAVTGDAIVGVAGIERYGDSALLRSVAVAPDWRGSGVGRALVDRIVDDARAGGVGDLYLLTTTAEHYFPKHGFACIAREAVPPAVQASAEFTSICPSTAAVMHRGLHPASAPT